MTIDERIERLEFQNSAYVEQRRKDWEEYLIRERDMKSHIEAIWKRMERRDEEYDKRSAALKEEQSERDRVYKQEQKERDAAIDARIDKLVSAIGRFIDKAS